MLKKITMVILALALFITTVAPECFVVAETKNTEDAGMLQADDLKKVKLKKVENLDEFLEMSNVSKDEILKNNFIIKSEDVGFINAKNNETGMYYNFYLKGNKILYYSTQQSKDNGNAVFKLYDQFNSLSMTSEITKTGEFVSEKISDGFANGIQSVSISKSAYAWACVFSSYMACIGVALAAEAAGTLVSGPFGTAAGFAGGAACRYLFKTAINKYGSKKKACQILTK
jgi:hypothetical protein